MKALLCWLALSVSLFAANPFLAHQDDKPVTRVFTGKEWGDDVVIPEGKETAPFQAKVTTQRVAAMEWGAIYKITFEPSSKREIRPYYFLATDGEILLLESTDMEREIRVISEMKTQPKFEKSDVWALTKGSVTFREALWVTEVTVRGNVSQRKSYHQDSGHFGRAVWKKGVGLVELAMGRGAMAEGFELAWKPKK